MCKKIPSALITSNHLSETDPFLLLVLFTSAGHIYDIRFCTKRAIAWEFPIVGLHLLLSGYVGLTKNYLTDMHILRDYFATYERHQDRPLFFTFYPEGTRFSEAKLEAAKEFARERGEPAFQHVLQPKHRGFAVLLDAIKNVESQNDLLDITIAWVDNEGRTHRGPNILDLATADLDSYSIHVHVDHFRMDQVQSFETIKSKTDDGQNDGDGEVEERAKMWLQWRYERKDALLETLYSNLTKGKVFCSK